MKKFQNSSIFKVALHPGFRIWSNPCAVHGFKRRRDCRYPGFGPEIVDFLLDFLQIPYEIVPVNITMFFGTFNNASELNFKFDDKC